MCAYRDHNENGRAEAKKRQDAGHKTHEEEIQADMNRVLRELTASDELHKARDNVLRAERQLSEQHLIREFRAKRRKDAINLLKEEIEFFRTSKEKKLLAEALRHVSTEVNLELERAEIENEERRAKAKRPLDFELLKQLPPLLEKLQQPKIDQLRVLHVGNPGDAASSSALPGAATQLPLQVMQGVAILRELLRFLDEGA